MTLFTEEGLTNPLIKKNKTGGGGSADGDDSVGGSAGSGDSVGGGSVEHRCYHFL